MLNLPLSDVAAGGALVLRVLEEGLVATGVAAADEEALLLGEVLTEEGLEAFCTPGGALRAPQT